ncbi:hypothetical protein HZS_6142, partial [Henneguya salminicola]
MNYNTRAHKTEVLDTSSDVDEENLENDEELLKELALITGEQLSIKTKTPEKDSANYTEDDENSDIDSNDEEIKNEYNKLLDEIKKSDPKNQENKNDIQKGHENEITRTSPALPCNSIDDIFKLKQKALAAKRAGDIEQAKKYLKECHVNKCFKTQRIKDDQNSKLNYIDQTTSHTTFDESITKFTKKTPPNTNYDELFQRSMDYYTQYINYLSSREGNSIQISHNIKILNDFKSAFLNFKNKIPYPYDTLILPPNFPPFPCDLINSSPHDNFHETDKRKLTISYEPSSKKLIPIPLPLPPTVDSISDLKKRALEAKRSGDIELAKQIMLKIKMEQNMQNMAHKQEINVKMSENLPEDAQTSICLFEDIQSALKKILISVSYKIPTLPPPSQNIAPLVTLQADLVNSLKNEIVQANILSKANKRQIKTAFQKRFFPMLVRNPDVDPNLILLHLHQIINFVLPLPLSNDTPLTIEVIFPIPKVLCNIIKKEKPQIYESPVFYSTPNTTELNFKCFFKIDRSQKSLPRLLKRANVQINIKVSGRFLIRNSETVGVVSLKFDTIITSSSFTDNIPIYNPKRMKTPTSSFLNITILVLDPLCGLEFTSQEINWLFVTEKAFLRVDSQSSNWRYIALPPHFPRIGLVYE